MHQAPLPLQHHASLFARHPHRSPEGLAEKQLTVNLHHVLQPKKAGAGCLPRASPTPSPFAPTIATTTRSPRLHFRRHSRRLPHTGSGRRPHYQLPSPAPPTASQVPPPPSACSAHDQQHQVQITSRTGDPIQRPRPPPPTHRLATTSDGGTALLHHHGTHTLSEETRGLGEGLVPTPACAHHQEGSRPMRASRRSHQHRRPAPKSGQSHLPLPLPQPPKHHMIDLQLRSPRLQARQRVGRPLGEPARSGGSRPERLPVESSHRPTR